MCWKRKYADGYDDHEAMRDSLKEINMLLRQGLKLSCQGSYQRRAPAPIAVPLLEQARHELKSWIEQHGETLEAMRLVALAEEALLNYDSAVSALEKVIRLSSTPNQRDLKRLAACREAPVRHGENYHLPQMISLHSGSF